MSLQEIHEYLEENVKILDNLYTFAQFIMQKKTTPLLIQIILKLILKMQFF